MYFIEHFFACRIFRKGQIYFAIGKSKFAPQPKRREPCFTAEHDFMEEL